MMNCVPLEPWDYQVERLKDQKNVVKPSAGFNSAINHIQNQNKEKKQKPSRLGFSIQTMVLLNLVL